MQLLKILRQEKGLTQQELANIVNTTRSNISGIERGTSSPSVSLAKRMASVFSVNWTIFFN